MNKPFYYMRHGETDWNFNRMYMGPIDVPLNQTGIEQARAATKILASEHIAYIASSPLSRALRTAEIVAVAINVPVIIIDELKENYGDEQSGQYVEKINDFETRVIQGVGKALELPGPVLIVGHGGAYHAVLRALNLPIKSLRNCEIAYHYPISGQKHTWGVRLCD